MRKTKAKGLGKGLEALISSTNSLEEAKNSVLELRINEVEPNTQQPRKMFDQERLEALAESIREHGVVQPIIVQSQGNRYLIIAGERRWRASKIAGLKTIPAIVKDISSREVMEIALIENLQREDLNPIEEAEAYQKLIKEYFMTQEEVAKIVGKSRAAVANSVRLLNLSESIKEMLADGRLTGGHARPLVAVADETKQGELAKLIVDKDLNVREVEKLVNSQGKKSAKKSKLKLVSRESVELINLENQLASSYGTKVNLSRGKQKGSIVFEVYSEDEFDRIIEKLLENG